MNPAQGTDMTKSEALTLFRYDAWAFGRVLEVAMTLTEEQYTRNLGASFGSVRGTLVHIHAAQQIWLDRWLGTVAGPLLNEQDIPTRADLQARHEKLHGEFRQFVEELTDQRLNETITYKDSQGREYTQTLYRLFQHLINHGTYHRGQLTFLFRLLGAKPLNTDLVNFYRHHDVQL
jgi:uncharacterized damage-inducible protein DinB